MGRPFGQAHFLGYVRDREALPLSGQIRSITDKAFASDFTTRLYCWHWRARRPSLNSTMWNIVKQDTYYG